MRYLALAAALMLPAAAVMAQAPATAPAAAPAPLATTRAADGQAVIVSAEQIVALAQRARQSYAAAATKNPNVRSIIIEGTPYQLGLEHRVGKAPASLHVDRAELMIILEGSGLYTSGGTLVEPTAPAANMTGTDIANGSSRQINKGDMFIVPENTPHMLLPDPGGPLLVATIHVPRRGAWGPPAPAAAGRGGAAPNKLFQAAADVAPMVALARTQLPTAARFFAGGTLISLAPYRVGLELRSARGVASVHKNNAEFMYVIDGEGIIETGGTMVNPKDTGANIDGDAMTGATINRMKKGDFIFVPKGVPHLARTEGSTFLLATMHVPGDVP
jgi:mannose-6-phosphate isomerase-like protein (cupin superfamily)